MKKRIFIIALLAAMMIFPTCKKKPGQEVTVQFSIGDAKIVSAAGQRPASSGEIISFDESIVTGKASVVDLNFGTKGVIRITENSNVKLAMLQDKAGNEETQFDMNRGKIYIILSKLSKVSNFSVKTPTTLAAVRGTSFMVVSDPKSSKISVLKGQVLVQLAQEGKLAEKIEQLLEANRKVVVSEDLANAIIAGKKKLEVSPLSAKEIAEIKEEIKKIKVSDKLEPDAQKELNELTKDLKTGATKKSTQDSGNKDVQPMPSL
jgi:hypothetical protein